MSCVLMITYEKKKRLVNWFRFDLHSRFPLARIHTWKTYKERCFGSSTAVLYYNFTRIKYANSKSHWRTTPWGIYTPWLTQNLGCFFHSWHHSSSSVVYFWLQSNGLPENLAIVVVSTFRRLCKTLSRASFLVEKNARLVFKTPVLLKQSTQTGVAALP